MKILLIDDDLDHRVPLQGLLEMEGYEVLAASDGEEGFRMARSELPDLVLLDIRMPKVDGIEACRMLRSNEATRSIRIIMLTADDSPETRIRAFNLGADDYVARPFRFEELLARIRSKLRRVEELSQPQRVLTCGNLYLDLDRMEAKVGQQPVTLSVLEFDLLSFLLKNRERVLSRQKILEAVWRDSVVTERTIDTHVALLRKKLTGFDHRITTIYGAGYSIKPGEG